MIEIGPAVSVGDGKPDHWSFVMVRYRAQGCVYWARACWVPARALLARHAWDEDTLDAECEWFDYDDDDEAWVPEGWWEAEVGPELEPAISVRNIPHVTHWAEVRVSAGGGK